MIENLLQYVVNIDTHLLSFIAFYGFLAYFLLFCIIFCETGFIIFPFLPGDSLLFATGSIAANTNELNLSLLFLLLTLASILGNKLNYFVGKLVGPRVFVMKKSWLLNHKHLERAHLFYQKHGGKTIIFARFIPIIRSFAPFVAGAANMQLKQFSFYNALSAILWIGSLLTAGYFLGSLPFVKQHLALIIYGIIFISLLPPISAILYQKIGGRLYSWRGQ